VFFFTKTKDSNPIGRDVIGQRQCFKTSSGEFIYTQFVDWRQASEVMSFWIY
jgi:hypothetical protein